ncbi:3-hydroxybutyryl-CoA dehydratase [Pseudobutyrivibrio sp. ACV-2]|jgi:3-hydroxybutyryl-CoA dehydratase|uniref:MaoC family dehydratase n=1 Tax=Pseudobutyrivibrio sp. ACV-2 TaxID=1520801 RepID=UPI00089D9B31|nr:MaoC family dehydratase [Pseudobutyrivibrio sp. ACV-2]SEA51511.1 3-hydroxybutyryl-CoA dehydratase [Pseudobutyrivibrio sp. ACV-2]
MNNYKFEDLSVGMSESFKVTITQEMLDSFKGITGDINPLHNDEAFAISKGHPGRVAYGMLTASFLSTLAGVYIPGERSLIQQVETKFSSPVYIGDELTVKGEIVELVESVQRLELKVTITNQSGKKVLRGKMQILVV